jgi:hypothetical protein
LSDPEKRRVYDLGLEHNRAEAQRRVRNAMAATAASFMVTASCGLYFFLPDTGHQLAGRREPAELSKVYSSPGPQPKHDAAAVDEGARVKAEAARFEEGARLAFEAMHKAELAEKQRAEQDQKRAAAEERARQEVELKRQADAAAVKKKEDEEALAIARAETEAKRKAAEEAKQQADAADAKKKEDEEALAIRAETEAKRKAAEVEARQQADAETAQRERTLRLHAQGLQAIENGNVSAARQFFASAANAGLCISAVALAQTYDPAQLAKLNVIEVQPDVGAAGAWYQKAGDLCASEAHRPKGAGREEVEFLTVLALAPNEPAADPLAQFRAAYTSGNGLAYVVIKEEEGEHIYRYGDESRLAAKKVEPEYTLFTCNTPHVFTPQKAEDKAALLKATVVTPGDPRFAELDPKYVSGCDNRLIKSAIPRN